jgi:alpha/beta superfamily hydrolase
MMGLREPGAARRGQHGSRIPKLGALLAALLALAVLAGCTVPRPEGAGTIRYRDQVFTAVTKTTDIQYGTAPDNNGNPVALKLDLYQPTGDTNTSRPAVIWVHGGGFSGGDKSAGPSADLANTFAQLGYVTVSINYRLLAPSGCTGANGVSAACTTAALGAIADAQGAVRWLRANAATYGVDPTRIGIGGESAGAITATGVGVFSENPAAEGDPAISDKVSGFYSISGGVPDGLFVSPGDAPGVLIHGDKDPIVPFKWSVDTSIKMLDNGVAGFLEPLAGAGHVPYFPPYKDQIVTQAEYFFYWVMDLGHAQGQTVATRRAFDQQKTRLVRRYPALAKRFYLKQSAHRRAAHTRSADRRAGHARR